MTDIHLRAWVGDNLRDLLPLISEAVQALDKPGTRALRRKIDCRVNILVHAWGSFMRSTVNEADWGTLVYPQYKRVTPLWPARAAHNAKKDAQCAAAAEELEPRGPRLVVDNARSRDRRAGVEAQTNGGAA